MQGALACGESADSVRRDLTSRREAGEAALRIRLQDAKQRVSSRRPGPFHRDGNPRSSGSGRRRMQA